MTARAAGKAAGFPPKKPRDEALLALVRALAIRRARLDHEAELLAIERTLHDGAERTATTAERGR